MIKGGGGGGGAKLLKEKLLESDNCALNLLDYVSGICKKLGSM